MTIPFRRRITGEFRICSEDTYCLTRSPIITAILAIVYVIVCIKTVDTSTNFQVFIVRTMLCGAVCFFLYQISGDKTLTSSYNSTGYVIKVSMGLLIIPTFFGIIALIIWKKIGKKIDFSEIRKNW